MVRIILSYIICIFSFSFFNILLSEDIRDSLSNSEKINITYNLKKNDFFRYRIETNLDSYENSIATDYKTIKYYKQEIYFYNKEVFEVAENGDIIFKVQFDSIIVSEGGPQYSVKKYYHENYSSLSSNIKPDSSDFLVYFSIIKVPFFIRLSKYGEIIEAYGFQQLYKNMFAIYRDTLNITEQENLKKNFGSGDLIDILQPEYQMFPITGINKNTLSWEKNMDAMILYWEVKNKAEYKILSINENLFSIGGNMKSSFDYTEYTTEDKIVVKIKNVDNNLRSETTFDNERSCVISKVVNGNLKIFLDLKSKDESGTSKQGIENTLRVDLLN